MNPKSLKITYSATKKKVSQPEIDSDWTGFHSQAMNPKGPKDPIIRYSGLG